jgi:hypothetical protein
MSRVRAQVIIGLLVAVASAIGAAELAQGQNAPQTFQMLDEATRLRGSGLQVEGQVLGGAPAPRGQWPATFVFQTGQGNCTATAVGRRVVITAAHCVPNQQEAQIIIGNSAIPLVCQHHPAYPNDISSDFALCLLDGPLPNLGSGFERINANAALINNGEKVLLLGYGCITNQGQRDFGNLYQGFATIADPSLGPLYIRTVGGAALCYGDSGGGAYWVASENDISGRRVFIAVNSRGDISTNSWLSSTATTGFLDWARSWAAGHGVAICGVAGAEDNCRPA